MKKLLLAIPFVLGASELKGLLENIDNNRLLQAYDYQVKSKNIEYISKFGGYLPKIDIGISASSTKVIAPTDAFSMESEDVSPAGYAKATWMLFDGFYNWGARDDLRAQRDDLEAQKNDTKNSLSKSLVNLYFSALNLQEDIESLGQKDIALAAQQKRLENFYASGLTSLDNLEKIKSAKLSNEYMISQHKQNLLSLKVQLELLSNQKIENLSSLEVKEPTQYELKNNYKVASLEYKVESINGKLTQIQSSYFPKIYIEDTYTYNPNPVELQFMGRPMKMPGEQNKVMANISMNVFDFFQTSGQRWAVALQRDAVESQIEHYNKDKSIEIELFKTGIDVSKKEIEIARQNLTSSEITYEAVFKKYQSSVADNVEYLDALSSLTNAKAQYKKSLNNFNHECAKYYLASGDTLEQYIK